MCFVFFCYLFLFDYPLIQTLIYVLSFLGGAVNGEYHGVIFPSLLLMFPFCFLCEKHVDISRTYPSSMFLIISLFDNSDMAIFKSRIVIIDQYLNNPSHPRKDINAVFLNNHFSPSNSGDYRNSLRSEHPSKLLPASFSCAVIAKSLIFALSGLLI